MYIEHATSQTSKSTNPKHVSFKGKSKIMIKGSKRQESSGGPTLLIPHLQSEQKKKKTLPPGTISSFEARKALMTHEQVLFSSYYKDPLLRLQSSAKHKYPVIQRQKKIIIIRYKKLE
jgi:hypothetical protein